MFCVDFANFIEHIRIYYDYIHNNVCGGEFVDVNEEHRKLLNYPPPIFNIGDKVVKRFLGYPTTAVVKGIFPGYFYPFPNRHWDEIDPNWREKHVYMICFTSPQKFQTLEEFIDAHDDEFEYEGQAKEMYKRLPATAGTTTIESDLSLFE